MRIPIPRNRLVQLTLVGALLTMLVAAGLVLPGALGDQSPAGSADTATPSADAPTPNENFTPAVSGGGGAGEHEEEEYEEEGHEEEYEGEEYEQYRDAPGAVGERP